MTITGMLGHPLATMLLVVLTTMLLVVVKLLAFCKSAVDHRGQPGLDTPQCWWWPNLVCSISQFVIHTCIHDDTPFIHHILGHTAWDSFKCGIRRGKTYTPAYMMLIEGVVMMRCQHCKFMCQWQTVVLFPFILYLHALHAFNSF